MPQQTHLDTLFFLPSASLQMSVCFEIPSQRCCQDRLTLWERPIRLRYLYVSNNLQTWCYPQITNICSWTSAWKSLYWNSAGLWGLRGSWGSAFWTSRARMDQRNVGATRNFQAGKHFLHLWAAHIYTPYTENFIAPRFVCCVCFCTCYILSINTVIASEVRTFIWSSQLLRTVWRLRFEA